MDYCRLCASNLKKPLIPILESNPLNIKDKVSRLLNINVNPNSKLPCQICLDCLTKLNQLNDFYTTATENQCILEIIFGKDEEVPQEQPVTQQEAQATTQSKCSTVSSERPETPKEQYYIIEEFTADEDFTQFEETEVNETKKSVELIPRKKFDRFDCHLCSKQFPGNQKFMQHFKDSHPNSEIQYKCYVCDAFVKKYRSYTRHIESHSQKRFTCDKCDKSFSQKITLFQHLKSHSEVKTYQCPDCNLNFKQNSSLFKHRRQKHSNNVVQCVECQKTFVNNETLQQHLRSKHKAESNISCDICSKKFASRSALLYHNSSHHQSDEDGKDRKCRVCEKTFKTPVTLMRHSKSCHP